MKWSQIAILLLGVCLITSPCMRVASGQEDEYEDDDDLGEVDAGLPSDDHVVVLTTSNFDSLIKQQKFALSLAPAYAAAAASIKELDLPVIIAKVDATEEPELAERYGVQGYPTIKWFIDGEDSEYTGGRDEDAIVQWVKKKTGPPAVTVSSADELTQQEASAEVLVVGYFAKLSGADHDAFMSTAQKTEDVSFVVTESDAAAAAAGLSATGVAVIKNFKGEQREVAVFPGDIAGEALSEFINAEKLPLTIAFNQENADKIFGAGIPRHFLMLAKSAELTSAAAPFKAFREVAAALKGQFVFVTVDADSEDADPVVKFFDLDPASTPALVAFEMEPKQRKFQYSGAIEASELRAFADGILDGSVQPAYKSEDIPEDDMDGDVKIVVGKSFDAVVKDPTKDVLLEVYAPWCGHCKSLAPIYQKLAKRFRSIDSVVIAKLDATANEHADLDVQGFPTILFYPAEEGASAVNYEGERTLKDMTKFIKEQAKIPYELKKKSKKDESESGDSEVRDEL